MPPPTIPPPRPPAPPRTGLARQRCVYHSTREAVARCPECRRFFCRECVTEHEDRLLCASCLKKAAALKDSAKTSPAFGYIRSALSVGLGFGVAWLFFGLVLLLLAALPTSLDFSETWLKEKEPPKPGVVQEKGN